MKKEKQDEIFRQAYCSDLEENTKNVMEELGMEYVKKPIAVEAYQTKKEVIIHTLEGDMKANVGDWILTGVDGEQWPVKDEIFKKTYEVADATSVDQLIENVKAWASERDIDKQSADAGYRKTIEELGELSSAYSRSNREMMIDSMGDATVCLINLATQMGLDFKECLAMAYAEISGRAGKMVNGVFVKDEDLKNKKDN